MNGLGNYFLAGSRFSRDQDGGSPARHQVNGLAELPHGTAFSNQEPAPRCGFSFALNGRLLLDPLRLGRQIEKTLGVSLLQDVKGA